MVKPLFLKVILDKKYPFIEMESHDYDLITDHPGTHGFFSYSSVAVKQMNIFIYIY